MPINLTATNHSLEIETSAAVQTQVVASFRDKTTSAETPGSQETNITTATTTTSVAAPAASTQRQIDDVEVAVIGTGSLTVKAKKDVGGTEFIMFQALLGSGERAHFTGAMGWRVFDVFGREKGTVGYALLKGPTLLTSGTTFTPSVGCTALLIELCAGGGAGGGAANPTAAQATVGSGGSHGGMVRKFVIGVPSSITYAIGALGAGVSGAAGNAGGNTTMTINGVTYTATGGTGGTTLASNTTIGETTTPASVSGTNGDENINMPSGSPGMRYSATQCTGGHGGSGPMGSEGKGRTSQGNGGNATGFGCGGGGAAAYNAAGAATGGSSAQGYIRVWEFAG